MLEARTGTNRVPSFAWEFQESASPIVEMFAGTENFIEGGSPLPTFDATTHVAGRRGVAFAAAGQNHLIRASAGLRAGAGVSLMWHVAADFVDAPSANDYILSNSASSHLNCYVVDVGGDRHVRLSVKGGASQHTITAALDVSGKEVDIVYGIDWNTDTSFLSVFDGHTVATATGDVTGYSVTELSATYIGSLSTLGAAGCTVFSLQRWLSTAAEGTDGADVAQAMRGGFV